MNNAALHLAQHQSEDMDGLIRSYAHLVSREVRRLCRTLPSRFDRSELEAYGLVGLYEAIQRYDASRAVTFERFARLRIRGAILDGVRTEMWAPSLTEECRDMEEARAALISQLGRGPSDAELAQALGIKPGRLAYLQTMSTTCHPISLDAETFADDDGTPEAVHNTVADANSPAPESEVLNQERIETLAGLIGELPERERLIITLVFYEELPQRVISQILGISVPRVSQLQAKTLRDLKRRMASDEFGRGLR